MIVKTDRRDARGIAFAGGSYTFTTGATGSNSFTVDASASFLPCGLLLTYAWDFNNDGLFHDATGVIATVPADEFGIVQPGTAFTIAFRVSDGTLMSSSYAEARDAGPRAVPEPATWAMMLLGFGTTVLRYVAASQPSLSSRSFVRSTRRRSLS